MYSFIALVLGLAVTAVAQDTLLIPHTDTFNSSANITSVQAQAAGIDAVVANNVGVALNFERTNWANGSVAQGSFYDLSANTISARPGSLLKVELDANTSAYTAAPNTAISRILFMTETLNDTAIPASAYVLWPYLPQTLTDGSFPVVAWAHGVSGVYGECGPSHVRNLWYDFSAPFPLAIEGYVVVAPDYAGLGVNQTLDGSPILHPFLGNPAHANDIFYAVKAAQKAFGTLSDKFVVMGQSQGGGAAWGAAQCQAKQPVPGYLGTIAASPVTRYTDQARLSPPVALGSAPLVAQALTEIFPGFDPAEFLTEAGVTRLQLATELQGCNSVIGELFRDFSLIKSDWFESYYAQLYQNLTANGGQEVAGPMLVLQGESDPVVPYQLTTQVVNETCTAVPETTIKYWHFENVTHVPVLQASQRLYMQWIADRFAGKSVPNGCTIKPFKSVLPYTAYSADINWFLEYATALYEVA